MTETDASTQQDAAAVFYVGRHLSARENDTVKSNVQAAKELGVLCNPPVATATLQSIPSRLTLFIV